MRIFATLLFCVLALKTIGQNKVTGHYYNTFGGSIVINSDSTFKYEFHFDSEASWTTGAWTTNKDTIYFRMIPIFDTLKYISANGTSRDSLQLSLDENPGPVTLEETNHLYSYGQNRHPSPQKLFFKHNRLYGIMEDGKLETQKVVWANKKFVPWFIKSHKE